MGIVLIVDTSAALREAIANLFQLNGFSIQEAADGKEAMEQVRCQVPDLVITDIIIPWVNGYELCQWLKRDANLKTQIPVVICSHRNNDFDRYWGKKKGADAFINKPLETVELIETVQQFFPQFNQPILETA